MSFFEHKFGSGGGGGFEDANLQKFKCPEGILKLRIDRCITQ